MNGCGEGQATDEWATIVSMMRGRDRLGTARRQEESPPRTKEELVTDLAGYQLHSQKRARKMTSSSLVPPSKTNANLPTVTWLPTPHAPVVILPAAYPELGAMAGSPKGFRYFFWKITSRPICTLKNRRTNHGLPTIGQQRRQGNHVTTALDCLPYHTS